MYVRMYDTAETVANKCMTILCVVVWRDDADYGDDDDDGLRVVS